MRKSVFLRRIVLLLLSAVLLSGFLSAGIYILVTQNIFIQTRANELIPIARTVAELMTDALADGNDPGRSVDPLLNRNNKGFLGASLHIYDKNGTSVMTPPSELDKPNKNKDFPPEKEDLTETISSELQIVLSGKEVSGVVKLNGNASHLVVGVPISQDGTVIGAVIFTKPVSELNEAQKGMYFTLFISTLLAFLIMLIPGYAAAKRLIIPIRQMNLVARAMAKGDFSIRADESQKGELGELSRSMNYFAGESSRLEQTRRDYVANVTHELRTPISSIRAMGETLRDGMVKNQEKQALFYNNIVRESLRLSRLVDDLLELSRLQSGSVAMQKLPFDLREVIQNIIDTFCHMAEEAGLSFVLSVDMEEALPVFCNPDRIEQVLVILLDNAMKHTPAGGLVTLSISDHENYFDITVQDTGEGINEEDLHFIFERFYKVDKSHSGNGTGLGLSIAREILSGLGETIQAKSSQKGTCFSFSIHKK